MIKEAVDKTRVALLATSHAVDDVYQGAVPALLPFFVAERHYSYAAAAGLTFAATALSSVIQPVFGALTDRRDLRWLVPAGLTTAGVGIGLSGLSSSYLLTWLAIALSGIGVAAFHPEGARAARAASGGSQQAMSIFSVGGNLGFAIGPLFVTAVLIPAGTHGTVFLTIPALVTGVVVYLTLIRSRQAVSPLRLDRKQKAAGDDWRGFAVLTAAVVARSILFFGLSSLLALYVSVGLHGGKQLGEVALTTMLVSGAAGTVVGGRLADRFGRLPVTRISFGVAAAGLVAVAFTGLPWVFLPVAVTAFALNQSFSLTVTLGQDYLPSRIGTSSGVTLGLAMSIGGLLAPAFGALADATSLQDTLAALVVFPLIALMFALRLREPRSAIATAARPGGQGADSPARG
jgi:MFS transporter, FSR family, fosmidomycin resistance protein